jgi:predicted esterase
MKDRARLSKRKSYIKTNGADFFGSEDFPKALISSLQKSDPKGMLFGMSNVAVNPPSAEKDRLRQILDSQIKGKRVLVCSGGADKLVPYHCAKPFLDFLKDATSGWYKDGNVYVEDIVYPGVGHAVSEGMVKDSTRFIGDILASGSGSKAFKI